MTSYFSGCKDLGDVRNRYRDLVIKHHPDVGGSQAVMIEINLEYEVVCKRFVRAQSPGKSESYYSNLDGINESIRSIIMQLLRLRDIKVEVCGLWVWVSGNTRPVKEELKRLGLRWSNPKQSWYYAGCPSHSRRNHSMDEIRSFYGSIKVEKEEN